MTKRPDQTGTFEQCSEETGSQPPLPTGMYTHHHSHNCPVGAPNGTTEQQHIRNSTKKIGERERRYQDFQSWRVSKRAKWAESEFLHTHVKAKERLEAGTWEQFQMLLGLDSWRGECWKHACHAGTRRKLANALSRVVAREVRRSARQAYFITIIHDDWRSPLAAPVVPLNDVRQRARDCLRFLEFEGLAGIEFDAITRAPTLTDVHLLAPHVHAIGFLSDKGSRKLELLRETRRLRCAWGAETVVCLKLNTPRDVRRTAAYMLKPALWTKRPVPRRNTPGVKLRSNRTRQTYLLTRLAEVLSYVGFKDLMLTCGKKSSWMTEAVRLASTGHGKRERWLSEAHLDRLWAAYWLARRRPHFERVKIT